MVLPHESACLFSESVAKLATAPCHFYSHSQKGGWRHDKVKHACKLQTAIELPIKCLEMVGNNLHLHTYVYVKYICTYIHMYIFFLKLLESKNGENWIVWVLTHWNLEPPAYTSIEGNIWKGKGAPKNNVFFEKGLNRYANIYIYPFSYRNRELK